ncbi:ATPase AAA [Streptomyces hygroscopicus subsp. limoneus]|nr:ATPase AAA [Streptomyces hygroscopicus subsp. limoneus]
MNGAPFIHLRSSKYRLSAQFPDRPEAAARDQMSYRGFLAELLMSECDDRARRRPERRFKGGQLPREKSLRAFDFEANPSVDPAVIHTLATCEWVKKGLPLCLIGDFGTGKPHLLIALEHRSRAGRLPGPLHTRHRTRQRAGRGRGREDLTKTIARYGRVDLLCIDELGDMELHSSAPLGIGHLGWCGD